MFDPDAGHRPTLRLGAKPIPAEPEAVIDAIAESEAILTLLRMLCDAVMDARTAYAQSQPISAQRSPTERTNAQHLARYDQADPLWRLHMGEHDTRVPQGQRLSVEVRRAMQTDAQVVGNFLGRQQFAERHRVMAGTDPLVAQTTGYVEPISGR